MDETTDSESWDKRGTRRLPARLTPWFALAALLISLGHIIYAVWRDHINNGVGVLGILR
jgi:hypothetical protein